MSLDSKSTLNNLIQKERLSRVANGLFLLFQKIQIKCWQFLLEVKKYDEKFKRFLLKTLLESCKIFSKKVLKFFFLLNPWNLLCFLTIPIYKEYYLYDIHTMQELSSDIPIFWLQKSIKKYTIVVSKLTPL